GTADLELLGTDLKVPGARLRGGGAAHVKLEQQGTRGTLALDANFDGMDIFYTDLIRKPAGTPLSFDVQAKRARARLEPTFRAKIGVLALSGNGTLEGETHPLVDATVKVESFAIDGLRDMMPSIAAAGLPPIHMAAALHARGRAGRPETMQVEVRDLR